MSLAALKKQSDFSSLIDEYNKQTTPQDTKSFGDDRIWKPELDKSGNGYAVIRFLPAPEGEDVPWQRMFSHSFQGPGGWYIENSLTTLGQKDPLAEYNSTLWNSGIEANKEIARKQKRRLTYFSNIFVIEDKANPQNEGKNFLFRYGKKIFDKVSGMANPEFEDESPIDVFSLWDGANFKLKIRKVDGFSNYDKSEFVTAAALFEDEAKLEETWNAQYSLTEFVGEDKFKSYDDLKSRLDIVLGNVSTPAMTAPTTVESVKVPFDGGEPIIPSSDEENLDYFKKLAEA